MSSAPAALLGDQLPRFCSLPDWVASEWDGKATELAGMAGLRLDPWQSMVLERGLGRGPDGRRAAFEVALIVSRQNGKGSILEALELAGLFLFDDVRLILHSAHEFKTASEAFRRIQSLVVDNPVFASRVSMIRTGAGTEAIELRDGKRLRFVARSSGTGRGFSADLVILDEAYKLDDRAMSALLPTLSARPDPQVWYTSSAGSEESVQLGRVRERGLAGSDPSLAFFEWSVPDDAEPSSPAAWARANPGMGIRITESHVERERAALSADAFAAERLGIGRYPTDLAGAWRVVPRETWDGLVDARSEPLPPVAFAVGVAGDRAAAAIGVAGRRPDGLLHVEVADYRPGTAWVVPRLLELYAKHSPCAVVVDEAGHEGSFVAALESGGVRVLSPAARQVAQGFGQFFEAAVDSGSLRHRGQPELGAALAGASTRDLADGRAWQRKGAVADISPLVAVTLAGWGLSMRAGGGEPSAWLV